MPIKRSVPPPDIDVHALAALDAIAVPLSVTAAVRDHRERLLDFRMVAVNLAAAGWLGIERDLIPGRLATELVPGLRLTGLFDSLAVVVATGRPLHERGQRYEGELGDGGRFEGRYDLAAIRLGDGYLSAWQEVGDGVPGIDLRAALERARAAIPVVRPEVGKPPLRLRSAT